MSPNIPTASPDDPNPASAQVAPVARDLVIALALSSALVILISLVFEPRWETNDDVAMSMVAHGYGGGEYGTPRLFFSSVLWGAVVRSLPSINGVLGYSIATLMSLTLAGTATIYFLLRIGLRRSTSVLIFALVFFRPILFPQFTVTAGLLAIAAILGLLSYHRTASRVDLVAACCLAFLAYLIRGLELALVTGVALPLLPWRKLLATRAVQVALTGLAVCIACATVADAYAYSSPEWQTFLQKNRARAALTDFGATKLILDHPDLLQRRGLSENDIRLVGNWFFVDPRLSDPELLKSLLAEIPVQNAIEQNLASSLTAFSAMLGPQLLPLTLAGLILLVTSFRSKLLAAWAICLIAFLALTVAGRFGVVRVYFPLFALLVIFACVTESRLSRWRFSAVILALSAGNLINVRFLIDEAAASDQMVRLARAEKFVSPESTVIWGGSFPFQYAFPVFTREPDVRQTRIYGLGVFTLAPFSVASADERSGRGLLERLRSSPGIPLISTTDYQSLLNTYCIEHFGSPLRMSISTQTKLWSVMNASCASRTE
ncbi:hypothetical protein FNL55_19490 [Tardiphaga sp. vice352]|uniref:hypothetical protein n=1 Tax=Tardiphaga sp. vice352 TaxID=2592816 RepID=UPI0011645DB5|nr:hypothetical protein [Tardiphaga sp. vice352]QDM33298.1 hypothetical protein FNL55_19490 [Tardiphaga sp. vice352]